MSCEWGNNAEVIEGWNDYAGNRISPPSTEVGPVVPEDQRKNIEMMKTLEGQEEYKGVLMKTTTQDGEEILYFQRSLYVRGYDNSGKSLTTVARNISPDSTASDKTEKLLDCDDTIHIFSRYGLTTYFILPAAISMNPESVARWYERDRELISDLSHEYPGKDGEFLLPINIGKIRKSIEGFNEAIKIKKKPRKDSPSNLFCEFHIPTGLYGEKIRPCLPKLHKRLLEANVERGKRAAETRASSEAKKIARQEKLRTQPQTPDDIVHLMRGGSLPR